MNPIETAVAPLRAKAIRAADITSDRVVENVMKDFAEHNWNIDECAPYPNSLIYGTRESFMPRKAKWALYSRLTVGTGYCPDGSFDRKNCYRQRDENSIESWKKANRDQAEASYLAYIAKLNQRIGEVVSAELKVLAGDDVWFESLLTVTKADGSVETWKTQMIVNRSKYDLLFNQWPTRRVKK